MGAKGKVTSLLKKGDLVLAHAIQVAVSRGLPLDSLSSSKRDYQAGGKLEGLVNPRTSAKTVGTPKPTGNKHVKSKARQQGGAKFGKPDARAVKVVGKGTRPGGRVPLRAKVATGRRGGR
jgi:hypothetical protein